MNFVVGSYFIFFFTAALFAASQTGGQSPAVPATQKTQSTQSRSVPYSMDTLLRLIRDTKGTNPMISVKAVINGIRQRGVSFEPTPERLEQIRKEGAPEELIKAIKDKAGIVDPPTTLTGSPDTSKPKEGYLAVICKPVDCVVFVDKKPVGSTKKGELSKLRLPEGRVTVSANSENYIPDKEGQVAVITDGASIAVDFSFRLSPVALQAKGLQLLESMVEALGGDAGLRESKFVKAVGTLTVHSGGPQRLWPITAFIQQPSNARFDITKANESYVIIHTESGYDLSKSKSKNLKGPELEELEDALRRVQEHQISRIVDRLRASGAKVTAEQLSSAPGEDAVFRVEQGPDTYVVNLGADSKPKEIKLETAGLNSGLRVLLSEYDKAGNAMVPHKTQVILPGTPPRGVVAQFDTVVVNPPGVDFSVKKGSRVTGR